MYLDRLKAKLVVSHGDYFVAHGVWRCIISKQCQRQTAFFDKMASEVKDPKPNHGNDAARWTDQSGHHDYAIKCGSKMPKDIINISLIIADDKQ